MVRHVSRRSTPARTSRWGAVGNFAWKHRSAIRKGAKNIYNRTRSALSRSSGAVRSAKRTKTVKKMSIKAPLDNIHSGVNKDYAHIKLHDYPKLGSGQKMAGTWTYTQTHSGISRSNAGRQNPTVIASGITKSQCVTTSGSTYTVYQNNLALEQLNPNLTNTGSVFIPTVVTPLNDRFFVKENFVEFNFTNFTGSAALCELYIVTAKNANASDPVNEWNTGYADDGFGKTVYTQPVPGAVSGGSVGSGNAGFVGATPTETSTFKGMWKIHHRHKFEMAGGSSYQHNVSVLVNKVIKKNVLSELSGSWITGTSWAAFLVQRGTVAADVTSAGAGPSYPLATTVATYSPTEIGWIVNVKTKCQAIAGNAARLPVAMYSNEVPNSTTFGNVRIINTQDNTEDIASNMLAST